MTGQRIREAVCDECGDTYNGRLGRKRKQGGIKLVLCPGCAQEAKLKEEAEDAENFRPGPRIDDDCAGCGASLKVVVRTWEFMQGFWGRVICANLCSDCEPHRDERAGAIYATVFRRQRRLRGVCGA